MRIGEIAAAVGLTTRAIRHYHHLGLLPEPARRPNGYRDYGLREAIVLARVKRLTELGLGLDEVRDVLADDAGRELSEVLAELDDDLARQEADIKARRARLAELLRLADEGLLTGEGPVSAGLAELFGRFGPAAAAGSPTAAKDLEHLALFDATLDPEYARAILASLLVDKASDLENTIHHDALSGVDVMPSGPWSPRSAHLLSSDRMRHLLEALEQLIPLPFQRFLILTFGILHVVDIGVAHGHLLSLG